MLRGGNGAGRGLRTRQESAIRDLTEGYDGTDSDPEPTHDMAAAVEHQMRALETDLADTLDVHAGLREVLDSRWDLQP